MALCATVGLQQRLSGFGLHIQKLKRQAAAIQQIAEFIGTGRPTFIHQRDNRPALLLLALPLVQQRR